LWIVHASTKDNILFISKLIGSLNQKSIFKEFHYFDRLTSTQDYAINLIKRKKTINPSVILCNNQSKGRGRKGNSWSSQNGGVWMSVILEANLKVELLFIFVMVSAICICKTIERETKLKTELKWPNDIFIDGKKIAGVLIDIETSMNNKYYIIIGMGINTNNDLDSTLLDIQNIEQCNYNITTLKKELNNVEISNNFFLSKLLDNLNFLLLDIIKDSFNYQSIFKLYKEKILNSKDKLKYTFNNNGNRFDGEIIDIDSTGSLLVKDRQKNKIIQISSVYSINLK
jgi:BirA family biotin operon repressor/biotin-[acetyl-CoA-carboxylase] ligase